MELSTNGDYLVVNYNDASTVNVKAQNISRIKERGDTVLKIVTQGVAGNTDIIKIKFSDVTSPVFGSFSDLVTYVSNFSSTSINEYVHVVTASEASTDEADISAFGISSISQVFLNNAFIPSGDYTFDGSTLSFDNNIDENDIITIYA